MLMAPVTKMTIALGLDEGWMSVVLTECDTPPTELNLAIMFAEPWTCCPSKVSID